MQDEQATPETAPAQEEAEHGEEITIDGRENEPIPANTTEVRHAPEKLAETMKKNVEIWIGTDPMKKEPLPKLNYKRETNNKISIMNELILPQYINNTITLEVHAIIYAAARTILDINGQHITSNGGTKEPRKPKWKIRIES